MPRRSANSTVSSGTMSRPSAEPPEDEEDTEDHEDPEDPEDGAGRGFLTPDT